VSKPAKSDFADVCAHIPVTPEEDEYFRELEMKAQPRPARPPEKAMTYDQYRLHIQTLRGTSRSRFTPDHGF